MICRAPRDVPTQKHRHVNALCDQRTPPRPVRRACSRQRDLITRCGAGLENRALNKRRAHLNLEPMFLNVSTISYTLLIFIRLFCSIIYLLQ